MPGEISELNLIQHELIGLHAKVVDTQCETLKNISGQIIDETMNTFKIEYFTKGNSKVVTVPKHNTTFQVALPDNAANPDPMPRLITISGTLLTKRPEDRIKKLAKVVNKNKKKGLTNSSTD
jgi:RNase P/RNase MRP subunit p29